MESLFQRQLWSGLSTNSKFIALCFDRSAEKRLVFGITNQRRNVNTYNASTVRNALFNAEARRQFESIGRIEKITVQYNGQPEKATLLMNKYISTPYNCAQHMLEMLIRRSALASVNGILWDMHKPLETDCELELHHFQDENPYHVNKAFWRSCSLMLGAVVSNIFKDEFTVVLHSFPWPNVRSGSFVYDVEIPNLSKWEPTQTELRALSAEMVKLSQGNLPVERLAVDKNLALDMFSENQHKVEQIPQIASSSPDGKIIVYRIGSHIDISRGPMISNSSFLGRCTIASVHKLNADVGNFYRFQGVALPKGILMNHYAYSILETRAKKLNKGRLPWEYEGDMFHPELQVLEASA